MAGGLNNYQYAPNPIGWVDPLGLQNIQMVFPGVKDAIAKSDSAKEWGTLPDGTNQGVKHFVDYWDKYPERIPSLEQRLGLPEGTFSPSVEGFEAFTKSAKNVISSGVEKVLPDDKKYILGLVHRKRRKVLLLCYDMGKYNQ
ncbi:hypothetical protein [Aeromonas sanarellii]